jgi:hypothetical protein
MARQVVESTRIVIRTDKGNRMELEGKGDAASSMAFAITFLNDERFAKVLKLLETERLRRAAKADEGTPS